jgi:hypothetical protein
VKRTLSLAGVALAAAVLGWGCGGGEPPAEESAAPEPAAPEPAPRVEAEEIDAALAAGAVLLDVRTDEELAEHGTIDGFIHIPIDELEARIGELPTGVPVLTA